MRAVFMILIIAILTSCLPSTVEKNGGLIFEVEVSDKTQINKTLDILRNRIDYFCYQNPTINYDSEKELIQIKLPKESDTNIYKTLILSNAKFDILETVDHLQLTDFLLTVNQILVEDDILSSTFFNNDSLSNNYPLFEKLIPIGTNNGNQIRMPVAGYCHPNDTSLINNIFHNEKIADLIPRDVEFMWSKFKTGDLLELIVTKKPVDYSSISNTMIEDVKLYYTNSDTPYVLISLKQQYHADWENLTRKNIGNALAIVIDDEVYSFPVVQAAIKGGKSQISGNFTEDQARLIVALLYTTPLTEKIKIKNTKIVNVP